MGNIAIIYASGISKNTMKVAKYISKRAGTDIFNLKQLSRIDLSEYDTVVFGTDIHAGKPNKRVVEFVEANRAVLADKRLHLFIVCKYDGEKGDKLCETVSDMLGIPDAVYFNMKGETDGDGFPEAVSDFADGLR